MKGDLVACELQDPYGNPDHIASFDYDLHVKTAELSKGDIFAVVVTLNLSDGSKVVVSKEADLLTVARLFAGENTCISRADRSLSHYIYKLLEYEETAKSNVVPINVKDET